MRTNKSSPVRPLPARIEALLRQLPETVELPVNREGSEPTTKTYRPAVDDGCWIACAPTARYAAAWGRSLTSAVEAVRLCLQSGGRPLKRRNEVRLTLWWQPREAWDEHGKLYPDKAEDVGPPWIDDQGCSYWWGSPCLTELCGPNRRLPGGWSPPEHR